MRVEIAKIPIPKKDTEYPALQDRSNIQIMIITTLLIYTQYLTEFEVVA